MKIKIIYLKKIILIILLIDLISKFILYNNIYSYLNNNNNNIDIINNNNIENNYQNTFNYLSQNQIEKFSPLENQNINNNKQQNIQNKETNEITNRLNLLNLNTQNIFYPNSLQNKYNNNSLNTNINNINNLNNNLNIDLQNNNIFQNNKDNELIEDCVNLCKEQAECRYLQKKISENPKLAYEIIYPKIKDKIIELSCDQFGNYFIQKVIEYLKIEQISELLQKKISNQFRSLCFNQHGTRVIQKIFERIINNETLLNYYTLLLNPNLKDFIIDANATHIIIKYVSLIQSPKNDFIIKFLSDNIFELSTKKHSCCAIQKCIEYSNQQQRKFLLLSVANKSFGLFTDQFGNYVVQYVVNICDYEINKIIVSNLLYDIPKFASQKFSSNVIEKCLDCSDEETKDLIVEKFCEQKLVQTLLFDMYGNYVLQKTMSIAKEPYKSKFFSIVGPIMENLKVLTFGQKLYNKLLSSFPELNIYVKGNNKNNKKKNKKDIINSNNNNLGMNINNVMFNNGNQFFNPYQYQRNFPMVNNMNNMMNINNFNVNNGNLNNQIGYIGNIDKMNYFNNSNYNFIGNMNGNFM